MVQRKKLNQRYIAELMKKFEVMHLNNSVNSDYAKGFSHELLDVDYIKYDKGLEMPFLEIRSIFKDILKSNVEKFESKESFVFYKGDWKAEYIKDNLSWKNYLEIVLDGNNYFDYLKKLKNHHGKEGLRVFLSMSKLRKFCTEEVFLDFLYIDAIIDIKEIKYKASYINTRELRMFRGVDNYWLHNQHEDAYSSCRGLFLFVVADRLDKEEINPKKDIPDYIKQIAEGYKIKGLTDELNIAVQAITNIRHKFGRKEPARSKEDTKLLKNFSEAREINKKICTRLEIDLLKTLHNLTMVLEAEKRN